MSRKSDSLFSRHGAVALLNRQLIFLMSLVASNASIGQDVQVLAPSDENLSQQVIMEIKKHDAGLGIWWTGHNGWLLKADGVLVGTDLVMGYQGVSCFGNPYFKTPEIDRLAMEGMRLTDFHSSGTVCSPTRAGLLTGRYQQRAGIEAVIHPRADHPEHRKGLQLSETTFAEVLAEAGYMTGLTGKWHQGYPQNSANYHPQNHGFHEFVGYHSGNIDFISHVGDHNRHDWWYRRKETREVGYTTDLINNLSVDFIRRHARGDAPFCLHIAHEAIHTPVQVRGDPVRRTEETWNRWKWQDVTTEERIEKYRGMVMRLDEGIGRVRETLMELGIANKTVVIFFSDNGPAADFPSGSPDLRGQKGSVYEGGHKVPAIA